MYKINYVKSFIHDVMKALHTIEIFIIRKMANNFKADLYQNSTDVIQKKL